MKTQVTIIAKNMRSTELKELMQSQLDQGQQDIVLETRERQTGDRTIDPTVLVAIVGVAGTGLGALITILCEVAKGKLARKIIIQSPAGSRIEVPVPVPAEELDRLLEKLRDLDTNREAEKTDQDRKELQALIL